MKNKQRLFIYDRKEMIVLFLITVMMAIFAFTLGVHLGKRVGPKMVANGAKEATPVNTLSDRIPPRQDLEDQSQGAQQAVHEVLSQELHQEITRTGMRLEESRQVDLPEEPKKKNAGATQLKPPNMEAHPKLKSARHSSESRSVAHEKTENASHSQGGTLYSLQIGSFPSEAEAKKQLAGLEKADLKGFLRQADLQGKGKWFRLYVGSFSDRSLAAKAGDKYKSEHKIQSFIVAKIPKTSE